MAETQYYATGRRKEATARVFLRSGSGTITINGVPLTSTTPLSSLKGSLIAVQGSGAVKIGP